MPGSLKIANALIAVGARLDRWIARTCALLIGVLVLIVWFGVLSRYFLHLGITWTEELARYVMIWAALLAVPVGVYRREHIGLELLFGALPVPVRTVLRVALDLIGLGFFAFLAWFGVGMTVNGASQYATIFGMTMMVPFASVPVSATLAAVQTIIVMLRDPASAARDLPPARQEEAKGAA